MSSDYGPALWIPTAHHWDGWGSVQAGTLQHVFITFYAARDNDPPGSRDIAYPGAAPRHQQATVGTGSYDDPITLAGVPDWLPVGTRVYVPEFHKYYIMEDLCGSAQAAYTRSGFHWIDLYLSDSTLPAVIAAENALTKEQAENSVVVINPPANLPVDTAPLYTEADGLIAHHYPNEAPQVAGGPRFIVLHETEDDASAEAIAQYFATTTRETSTHFVVDRAGVVAQSVALSDRAWGNGAVTAGALPWFVSTNPNNYSLSIEICKANGAVVMTAVQQAAVFALVRFLVEKFNLPRRVIRSSQPPDSSGGVVGHCDIDPINKGFDPGAFDYDGLLAYLQGGADTVVTLPNFPYKNQLNEQTIDGRPPENGNYDCVPTSFAACIQFETGRFVSGDELKDAEYGEAYTNAGTSLARFIDDTTDRARAIYHVTADRYNGASGADLVARVHAHLRTGHPVIVTIPSQWGNVYPWSQRVSPPFSTHVVAMYSEEGGLTAMNPWNAQKHTGSDQYWADRLCYGQIWLVHKEGAATMALDIAQVSGWFVANTDGSWKCKQTGKTIRGAMLDTYRNLNVPVGVLPLPGLPLTDEIYDAGGKWCRQEFERAIGIYDPGHVVDNQPGFGTVYFGKIGDPRFNGVVATAQKAEATAEAAQVAAEAERDEALAAEVQAKQALLDVQAKLVQVQAQLADAQAKLAAANEVLVADEAELKRLTDAVAALEARLAALQGDAVEAFDALLALSRIVAKHAA